MKKLIFAIIVLACLVFADQPASAHVLISDENQSSGAVLHSVPDDDPIAGEAATLYLDTQYQLDEKGSSATLVVTDAMGIQQSVPMETEGTLAVAKYVFPSQGAYELTFAIKTEGETHIFKQSQRVSRGAAGSQLEKPSHAWAEILLIASIIGFALLAIAFAAHRKELAKHSTF